ncbi:mycofactocin system transcriptional regulator [Mycobacteroides abscessus]|uniref:Bacterial regulatory s, tetR family protein n=3 Tax=Mycobacteroides abscessus TaxID=36809 RepID=A0A829QH69_9MYCO|nr:mycofactocin system transcriptional regulator [Mycobacteroides abscessus]EUA62532.1 bacterial regulatory s, tetR family protein [Mycobacteroides abscessus 1948]ALM18105.1 mycofactocin system transcriptional regulator [Mycobacteroides abscessus]AMU47141.1 mycofactocin system transcriptional regulator [Mycobacteroides abscessus]AMU52168.1 mycofactocin system transcriptional regulator [Mycobacteroides abscessus]ANO10852.1 mycofactocin system transcriptional regulator [Mycobacteroides abscessus
MNAQPARVGRRPSTTRDEITAVAMTLFAQHGFDEVSVDDIAAAAGIARRTVFRYYSSKNAIVWGDFDSHLGVMRALLDETADTVDTSTALRQAVLTFNDFPVDETPRHRMRMRMILEVPALQAYSMLMYTGWRDVIAQFVARRSGTDPGSLLPQTVAWTLLGVALAAYEQWLADESSKLTTLLGKGFDAAEVGLRALR